MYANDLTYFPTSRGAPAQIWETKDTRCCQEAFAGPLCHGAKSNRLPAALEVIVMTMVSEVCSLGIHHSRLPFPTAATVVLDAPLLKQASVSSCAQLTVNAA